MLLYWKCVCIRGNYIIQYFAKTTFASNYRYMLFTNMAIVASLSQLYIYFWFNAIKSHTCKFNNLVLLCIWMICSSDTRKKKKITFFVCEEIELDLYAIWIDTYSWLILICQNTYIARRSQRWPLIGYLKSICYVLTP